MSNAGKYTKTSMTTAIAAALAPAGQAVAQEQEANRERVLEEVIVTATLREASMQDLAQSLQAFTAEDIVRNNFVSFDDVANAIPSLTLVADTPGRNQVKFRGISTGTGEYYTGSLVAIYFDETPLTFSSQQLWPAMVDIERVESLPGPQGTLFGSSSLAGTVRVVTNKPDPTAFSGEAFASYYATEGGEGSWELNSHVNIPLIQDTLALRVVLHTRDEGGWIDNVLAETYVQPDPRFKAAGNNAAFVEEDANDYELTGGRASLLWNVNDDWRTIFTLISEENLAEGSWAEDPNIGENQHAIFHDEFREDDWWNTSLLIEGDLGFATLTSSTTYLDREINYEWENMIYEQYKDSVYGVYVGYKIYNTEYTYGNIFNDQTQDRVSQELRLTSNTDSRFQWMIGGFYEEINDQWYYGARNDDLMDTVAWYYANYLAYYYSAYYDITVPLPPTNVGYSQRLDRTQDQLAFFGEVSFDITEKWIVTGGARWFQFKQDYFEQNQFPEGYPPFRGFDNNGIVISDSKDEDTVFKFSTQYFFTDDVQVYALYSEGFRLGGENTARASATGLIPATYGPDFLNNYEAGLKSSWFDNSLQVNVNLFYMDWENRQFSEGSVDGQWWLRGTVNASDTETTGVELNLTWQATDNLRFEGNLTSLDAEISDEYTFLDGSMLTPGDPLPNAPELSYWAAVDYTFPFDAFGGELWTRVDYAYGDEYWDSTGGVINRDPLDLIPDWNNTNLQLGLSLDDGWTITAFVNNLTDERRINFRQDNTYASDWFGTDKFAIFNYIQRPRHYGISVRKRFN